MTQKHFNRSLSQTRTVEIIATVKWQIRVKAYFLSKRSITMTNGGGRGREWHGKGEAIVIRRSDIEHVHDFARVHCKLRDFLLIRVPMKSGIRTTEIRTLNIEDIDFELGEFQVLDSKKKRFYPLPLDVLTLQFIKDLIGDRVEGTVFAREDNPEIARQHKPMSRTAIWYLIHGIGVAAGVKGVSPRLLRHYFVASLMYPKPDEQGNRREPASIETVRRMLRHKNLATTTFYVARLVFPEDIKRDYDRLQNPYVRSDCESNKKQLEPSSFYEEYCSQCDHEQVCSLKEQMCSLKGVSGCRFYKQKKEMVLHE